MIFTFHKILLFLDFFQPFKDVKSLLSLWDVHKQLGQIWPTGHSLLAPASDSQLAPGARLGRVEKPHPKKARPQPQRQFVLEPGPDLQTIKDESDVFPPLGHIAFWAREAKGQ